MYKSAKQYVRGRANAYVSAKYGARAAAIADQLFQKATKAVKAQVAPGAVIKGTKLKSYLDRTYARKCGVEVKQYEIAQNAVPGTTLASSFAPLEGQIIQGLTDQNRIGSKIELKQIQFRFTFNAMVASTGPSKIRIIVVKVGEQLGTNPSAGQILETGTNIRSLYAQKNDVGRSFTIVKDKLISLSALNSGENTAYKEWNWTYRPKGCHEVEYLSSVTTGNLADMTKGNFVVYMMYESKPTAAQQPSYDVYARVQFIDP